MISSLRSLWACQPLVIILVSGLFFRLVAAVFSKGYGMIDDHFLIIEQAQSWVDKVNVNDWLPQLSRNAVPPGFSYFYTGLHYLLFLLLERLGMHDPQAKMYVVRLLHALYSMLTVYFGYRIAGKVSGRAVAKQVGLFLALFWLWPFLSVRNLVEMVCIPPLMAATWMAVKHEKGGAGYFFAIGLLLGLAFNIRFQSLLFSGGFILALLIRRQWLQAVSAFAGLLICFIVIQGGIDWYIWDKPFIEFKGYVAYNLKYSHNFIVLPWYSYLLLLAGIFIPPVSFFLLAGYLSQVRRHLLLFLPSFVFLLFHSYFPNKQERFILPVLPFIITLGLIGWNHLLAAKPVLARARKLIRCSWLAFYGLNAMLLVVISVTYSKRNRVEAMRYLAQRGNVQSLIIDNSDAQEGILSPRFYLEKWVEEYQFTSQTDFDTVLTRLRLAPAGERPNYIVFYAADRLEERLDRLRQYVDVDYETTIYPSFVDDFMYRINPVNDNAVTYIYRIKKW